MKNFVIDSSHPGYLDNVLGKSFGLKINGMVYVPSKTFYKKTVMPSMAPLVLRFNLNYRKISISLHGSLTHKTGFREINVKTIESDRSSRITYEFVHIVHGKVSRGDCSTWFLTSINFI